METASQEAVGERTSIGKVALASLIGTSIEWYDFYIYGTAVALIVGDLFFPGFSPLAGTLAALSTFTVGFIARPVGGAVFGHYGDRIGRKALLVITLLGMGVATFLVGLMPTFETIGVWAPILLVTLRFIQGFCVGGEWGGAVLMSTEHSPEGRRGFYGSWPQIGVPIGLLASTGIFALISRITTDAQFAAWGWRIPFLLSILLVGVGLFIRLRIMETPAFTQMKETGNQSRLPVVEALRTFPKSMLLAAGSFIVINGLFYLITVFTLSYATDQLGLSRDVFFTGVMIAATLQIFSIPAFGALSDRIGRRPVYMGGAAFIGLFAFPLYFFIATEVTILIWLAIVLALVGGHAAMYGPQASFYSEMFPARVRYSGASMGYQIGGAIGGGVPPLFAAGLVAWTGGHWWPIAALLAGMAVISFVCVYLATETYKSKDF